MVEVLTVDAASTIQLLESIEALYPMLAPVHVFLDNARYHHPPGFNPGINRCRRLAKDCENLTRNALAFLRLASFRPMLGKPCLS
jgi:hypothetical protein